MDQPLHPTLKYDRRGRAIAEGQLAGEVFLLIFFCFGHINGYLCPSASWTDEAASRREREKHGYMATWVSGE